jgi:hypothetical protein
MACISLVSVPLVFAIATFRGEWLEEKLAWTPLQQIRQVLVDGKVDLFSRIFPEADKPLVEPLGAARPGREPRAKAHLSLPLTGKAIQFTFGELSDHGLRTANPGVVCFSGGLVLDQSNRRNGKSLPVGESRQRLVSHSRPFWSSTLIGPVDTGGRSPRMIRCISSCGVPSGIGT